MLELEKHRKTSHYNCEQCDFKTTKKTLLQAHKNNHKTKPAAKTCDKCEFS